MPDPTHARSIDDFITVDAFNVSIADGPNDEAVVSKDHSGPLPAAGRTVEEHQQAIDREVQWLRQAAGLPGIVRLAPESGAASDGLRQVRTLFAGSATIRSGCPDPATAARALAGVARTLAQLAGRGLTHGSVTPEHIILGTDGRATLCSPNTGEPSTGEGVPPESDLVGLGRVISFATEQWDEPPENLTQWLLVAHRLEQSDPTMSAHRAALMLDELAAPSTTHRTPRRRGRLAALAISACGLLTVLGFVQDSGPAPVSGPEVEVAGSIVQVGVAGQLAVAHSGDDCSAPAVFVLDPVTFWVWTFTRFHDGSVSTPLVQIPGATSLAVDSNGPCQRVVARGPAGAVNLMDSDLGAPGLGASDLGASTLTDSADRFESPTGRRTPSDLRSDQAGMFVRPRSRRRSTAWSTSTPRMQATARRSSSRMVSTRPLKS